MNPVIGQNLITHPELFEHHVSPPFGRKQKKLNRSQAFESRPSHSRIAAQKKHFKSTHLPIESTEHVRRKVPQQRLSQPGRREGGGRRRGSAAALAVQPHQQQAGADPVGDGGKKRLVPDLEPGKGAARPPPAQWENCVPPPPATALCFQSFWDSEKIYIIMHII